MRTLLAMLFALTVVFPANCYAQSAPRLEKKVIGNSGCFGYFPKDMPDFEVSYSEDGAAVFTSEIEVGEHNFSCITVKFKDPFVDSDREDMQELLISYLDFLQSQFGVTGTAGYGKGHTLESNPNATGILDYWEDADGLQYAVKGWVDQSYMGINFIYGKEDYPFFSLQEMFLNGFRFP